MSNPVKYTEQELVLSLKQRNGAAFSYLYDCYSGALLTTVLSMVSDKVVAEDILQEVFLKIFKKIDSYDATKSRLYTWLLNITRNETIDTLRSKQYRNNQQNREGTEIVYDSAGSITLSIDKIGLRKLLEQITPEYQELIDLAYFKGFTQQEIAQIQDIPLGTVKTRLRTALSQLRTLVGLSIIFWILCIYK